MDEIEDFFEHLGRRILLSCVCSATKPQFVSSRKAGCLHGFPRIEAVPYAMRTDRTDPRFDACRSSVSHCASDL